MIDLDNCEIATVLAGLRLRQQQLSSQEGGDNVDEIASNLGEFEPLGFVEIELLCALLLHA